jgi:hypothetical protein
MLLHVPMAGEANTLFVAFFSMALFENAGEKLKRAICTSTVFPIKKLATMVYTTVWAKAI